MCKMLCVHVMQEDLDESEVQFTDPIKEAIEREYTLSELDGYVSESGATGINIGDSWFEYPDEIVNWMYRYDLGEDVKPVSFTMHAFCEDTEREAAIAVLEKESKCR